MTVQARPKFNFILPKTILISQMFRNVVYKASNLLTNQKIIANFAENQSSYILAS